ncbi:MAG: alpha/beta fold hydrolase, partial [Sphingobacterium sp.]
MRCVYLLLIFMASIPAIAQEKMEIFDEIQENVWYLPTEDGKAKLYISSLGAGDTVVVLHGGPGNNFNYLVDAVRGNLNDHCFLFFDQRGSIYSPVPDSSINELTLSQLVDDLETLRKATGQEKLTLLGHSFGSLLAISYYIKYPQSVERIILSGAMPPSVSEEHPFSELVKDI